MGYNYNTVQQPRLILFCGLPGSGKSTIARQLEQDTGAIRLNVDEWVSALGVDFWDDKFRHNLERKLYIHGLKLLEFGQSFIFEDNAWTKVERDEHRAIAQKLGVSVELHYFDLNFDEIWKRLEVRNATGAFDTVPISKKLLKECWQKFELPEAAELALFDQHFVYY